ncbi:glycosyltransferase family 32 protein [Haemophilus paraphrohaemolyticus]|jgi:hypothetical protein|uniref:Capsular polysaccharide synthesis protein n=1 Tax=Haemophilus paraphrohaemolyticus HK411 TaxID=1095743 RepID=I2NEZ4_9PAST|nr:capsular polysaccharide synthesis protein [Haemophilus paraphrohaemolyticus]EIG24405.1 hypothetical protein HMPREF1054_0447 [Haemophilus paraphrohaemolyticus HK411]OOR95864.1 hypothetical protein B0184_02515 [Haemophilus paraphrohaemolyticus]STP00312.1 Mannosyltransferase OCH1 and related enzymes [Haemophilus paraphrohaemolyticus]
MLKIIIKRCFRTVKQIVLLLNFVSKKNCIDEKWMHINKGLATKKVDDIPRIIWVYWDSNKENHLVNLCIESMKTHFEGYQMNILNKNNIQEYIDLPVFHKDLKPAGISDFIRFSLLKKYGGIWIDASVFFTQNLDWIFSKMNEEGADIFLCYSDECTIRNDFPVIDSWFIIAPAEHPFIIDWLEEFKKAIFSDSPTTYYNDYINNKDIIQNIPNVSYLICYVSAMVVLSRKKYDILYLNSGSNGHYFNYKLDWNRYFISLCVLLYRFKNTPTPKLIKFTGLVRFPTEALLKYKFYNKKSILGELFIKKENNK